MVVKMEPGFGEKHKKERLTMTSLEMLIIVNTIRGEIIVDVGCNGKE